MANRFDPRRLVPLLVFATLVAGCVEPAPSDERPPVEPPATGPWAYRCGEGMTALGEACYALLGDAARRHGEPTVALHPGDAQTAAIAAIVAPAGAPATPAAPDLFNIELHVTQDGGRTWRHVPVPLDAIMAAHPRGAQVAQNIDPAIAFDPAGTLHVTGLVVPILGGNVPDVYHIASPDLGRTWGTPTYLTQDGKSDRNWLSIAPNGTLFVAYAEGPDSAQIASSVDGGATWTALAEPLACFWFATAPVHVAGANVTACTSRAGGMAHARIHGIDAEARTARVIAALTSPVGRPFLAASGDGLLLVVDASTETWLHPSPNGTDGWRDPVALRPSVEGAAGWTWMRARWATTDPAGDLHVLYEGGAHTCGLAVPCDDFEGAVVHVVYDAVGTKQAEWALTPSDAPTGGGPLALTPPDDYHGAAFGNTTGYVAWTSDGRLAYGVLERTDPSTDGRLLAT